MKTFSAKTSDVVKKWIVIDATDKAVGRVASTAAAIIRGKTKPIFTPHVDTGDNVIIINAAKAKFTGSKAEKKVYYHHTGFPGGIKETSAKALLAERPVRVFEKAINGMLPKNRLGRTLKLNYRVYEDDQHPHVGQKPDVVVITQKNQRPAGNSSGNSHGVN